MRAQADGRHPDLGAALDLLLSAGGKRVRPALTLLAGRMLGAPANRMVTLAAAIELLHTATLVHDDLIDGSLLRRGMPTLNSQWSPGATVLTGDFLFACAAKLASDTDSVPVMSLFSPNADRDRQWRNHPVVQQALQGRPRGLLPTDLRQNRLFV